MKQKLKKIGLEFIAAAIISFGVGFVTLYLVMEFSFLSLFVGMIGYLILRPAISHYAKEIDELLKKD